MDLEAALNEFDAAETTLRRLETVWQRMTELVPQGIAFVSGSPESLEYDELRRAFRDLAAGLPTIDGWTIAELPWALDDIAQARFEARDLGELEVTVSVEQGVAAPGEAIREYRFRFNRARRGFVRHRTQKLLEEIPTLLSELQRRIEPSRAPINDPGWDVVVERFREIDRLIGPFASLTGRWNDLRRHLAFAQGVDLHDIAEHDWPSVVNDIHAALYREFEPLPLRVGDLGELVEAEPTVSATTRLEWSSLQTKPSSGSCST